MFKCLNRIAQIRLSNTYLKCGTARDASDGIKAFAKAGEEGDGKSNNADKHDLDIAASLFENSSVLHKPGAHPHKAQFPSTNAQRPNPVKRQEGGQLRAAQIIMRPMQHQGKVLYDQDLNLEFTRIDRQQDPLLGTLLTRVRSRKRRDKDSEILIEGRRLIRDALNCGLQMDALLFTHNSKLHQLKSEVSQPDIIGNSKIYKVTQHDLKTWSTLSTPPGLMAIFKRPTEQEQANLLLSKTPAMPITVVCDNIREPNNLGSIIRTCAAIPCFQVLVTRGCCDPWESKALRGGCGGQFRVKIHDDIDWQNLPQLIPTETSNDYRVFIAENNPSKALNNATIIDYTRLEKSSGHNVLIVGGESHGVSQEAYKFLETASSKANTKCLHIPLADGVDSLNVVSAVTLILYELRKNLLPAIAAETQIVASL